MKRQPVAQYRLQVMLLMALYVVLILFVWPYAKTSASAWLRTLFALLPTLPVIGVMGVMARRVVRSDELEQRVHMSALGVSTAIICVASLIGGFLAAARLVAFGGDVLIWVFPLVCVSYCTARWLLGRRYGGDEAE